MMETAQAQRFVAAFASFAVFAVAYTQFSDVIRISPSFNIPASMSETIEVLVVLFFVSSNMIMMLRSLTIRGLDENRSILLALVLMAGALLMMFTAKVIDSRYVLEFTVVDEKAEHDMVLIRPFTLSPMARDMFLVDDQPTINFIENRAILQDLTDNLVSDPERFDVIVIDNGIVAFTYAFLIASSKALLLFSFSLLTWAAVMLAQRVRNETSPGDNDVEKEPQSGAGALANSANTALRGVGAKQHRGPEAAEPPTPV